MQPLPPANQLAPAVLRTGSPLLFALAGRVAAEALVRGTWARDIDVVRLLDAMSTRLPEVADAIGSLRHPSLRVEVAAALAVLVLARPELETRVRYLLRDLVQRTPSATPQSDVTELRLRALLAVATDQDAIAQRVVAQLDAQHDALGTTLGKWAAGQRHRAAFVRRTHALSTLTRRFAGQVDPRVLVIAAFSLPTSHRTRSDVASRRRYTPVPY